RELDLEGLLAALGVEDVQTVDPNDMLAVRHALKAATGNKGLSVVVFRSPCVLLERKRETPVVAGDECTNCGVCLSLGCPAISFDEALGHTAIDESQCIGCGQCEQYCSFGALKRNEGEARHA
ncbi:MAG: 4Fe-4S binding protein, partial [Eggerthellaceae bacterium]|nr:4Fe-4S binding protein [Eggerthellaceae bacterium]